MPRQDHLCRAAPLALLAAAALASACSSDPGSDPDAAADAADTADTTGADTLDAADTDTAPDAETDAVSDTPDAAPSRCIDSAEPGTVEVFFAGFEHGSEGAAFGPDGMLYVTGDDALWRFDATGAREHVVDLPYPLGVAPVADGLVVAGKGPSNVVADIDGAVWHVSLDGTVTPWTTGIASPNFVAMAPDGAALVSDDFDRRVFRVTAAGDVSEAILDVPSPNGMAWSPDGTQFYVVSTFSVGEVWRYDVDADGLPVEASAVQVGDLGLGATADGVAMGADGALYVAANLRGEILRVDPETGEVVKVAEGVATAASLAFGAGEGFDPCSLYATSLFGTSVYRVVVGAEGAPVLR